MLTSPRLAVVLPLIASLVVVVTLVAGCGSGPAGAAAPATVAPTTVAPTTGAPTTGSSLQTRSIVVSPVTSGGVQAAGYRTASTAGNASCEPGSEAIGQAYRCFAGNNVYDPCWAEKAAAPTVLCLGDPWSVAVAKLTVSSGLSPIPSQPGLGEPWGVQLATGARCLLAQGAHGEFRGHVIDYYCGPNLSLLRGLTRTGSRWTAQSVAGKPGQLTAGPPEQITIAWYGSPDRHW